MTETLVLDQAEVITIKGQTAVMEMIQIPSEMTVGTGDVTVKRRKVCYHT